MTKDVLTIVLLSSDYLPNIGGVAAHVAHMARSLKSQGHNVVVINPIAGDQPGNQIVDDNGVLTYRPSFRDGGSFTARRIRRVLATLKVIKKVSNELGPVHVIHQHDGIASALAVRLSGHPGLWVWTNHTSGFLQDLNRALKRNVIKHAFAAVDGILAPSPELRDKSRVLWGSDKNISFIPNGVDITAFHPNVAVDRASFGLSKDDFVVLCPRRMVPKNGVLFLARAVTRIISLYPDVSWRFCFLGSEEASNTDAGYISDVKRVLSQAHSQGYVKYLGNVPMEDMPRVNALADVVVMPSLMEAVSLSALEALAVERSVVATNVGGLPIVVRHESTGLLVPPENSIALAEAIVRMYHEPELRRLLAVEGQKLVSSQYTWDVVARQTVSFYRTLLDRRLS